MRQLWLLFKLQGFDLVILRYFTETPKEDDWVNDRVMTILKRPARSQSVANNNYFSTNGTQLSEWQCVRDDSCPLPCFYFP